MNRTAYQPAPHSALRTARLRLRHERGTAAVEFAMVFPLFFVILYGIITYSVIFVAQQNLTLAAEEGARAALNYQTATSTANALAARSSAACSTAKGLVASLISSATCVSSSNPCSYDGTMDCIIVTLTYNYAGSPLVPNLPLTNFVLPASLVSSATVQLNPENIL
ncbi:MAG: TadE/TadG family type IV pilus assembly protein [Pseudomonadota bacterium]|jgi:Flp pilus assembly protein TadG|uniref:TadE/TadG family type IV pilus assembly protein n=1 Tax=Burkholderiaceae TaxID=119060 RepID=UPI0010F8C673|nr:TadE/TadG family type IV pilus assembly protein [Burkholderia sp. 4M9327F10]